MSDLDRLFYWRGITPDFYNYKGELTPIPLDRRVHILAAMGVDVSSPESIASEAFELDIKPWLRWLPPLSVVHKAHPFLEINFQPEELDQIVTWTLTQNGNTVSCGEIKPHELEEVGDYAHDGSRYSRRELALGELSYGYYDVMLARGEKSQQSTLAVAPSESYQPSWASHDDVNPWGFVVQLYTLRSENNWGIGDFSDLDLLIEKSSVYGVDIIGLNPFHALQSDLKHNFSPYAPSDRRYLNPLYIDVERAPGFDSDFKQPELISIERGRTHVRYEQMQQLKYSALYRCFERFLFNTPSTLADYIRQGKDSLIDFANYEALSGWQPDDLVGEPLKQDDLLCFLSDNKVLPAAHQLVAFHCYLQFVAEQQLSECQLGAEKLGMKVGIVRDLAVGASGGGSEAQTNAKLFCHDAAIGAPPDAFSHTGQSWGMPPMDPAELRKTGFSHYINLLRSNMHYCGALRIDHAMSLYRLWWCAKDQTADNGAYIHYPLKEMVGLLCLESYLNKCVVIAEDLGIVPDEFRAVMNETKFYSNRVFYFEKNNDTELKHPRDYERHALAMLDNHDLPTLCSWWNATDLSLRKQLDLFSNDQEYDSNLTIRLAEKNSLIELLRNDGLLPEGWHDVGIDQEIDFQLVEAILQFVGRASSQFYMVQLEDLLMMNDPVNVPGTYLEYQNWSRKLDKNIEDIFSNEDIDRLLRRVSSTRTNIKGK